MSTDTDTRPAFMTTAAYEEARDFLEAVKLNRDFIRHERTWSRTHAAGMPEEHVDYSKHLDHFAEVLDTASRIWAVEHEALRQRIADRIRAEIPDAENYNIPQAIESGDYSMMAC